MKGRCGVLLVQLGTPDAPTLAAYRRYLREFLSDPRVIEAPRLVWWFLLRFVILRKRPATVLEAYRRIWDPRDGSPLLAITSRQSSRLASVLARDLSAPPPVVGYAMRYGAPGVGEAIDAMAGEGCDRLVVLPLYPQYSAAATGSALDHVFRELSRRRFVPAIRTVPPFYGHPAYIGCVAALFRDTLGSCGFEPETIVLSFHGIPISYVAKGDPYAAHCERTAELLRREIGFPKESVVVAYQSRFGKEPWLEPATDETLRQLPRRGVRRVVVATPGFTTDCL